MQHKLFLLSLAGIMLTACGGGTDNSGNDKILVQNGSSNSSVFVRSTLVEPGESCEFGGITIDSGFDSNSDGVLNPEEITNSQTVCHGSDGLNSIVAVNDEGIGANCGTGGKSVAVGQDANRNNVLDPEEIQSTDYVCNGANGANGNGGNSGNTLSCSIVDGLNGAKLLECADGSVVEVDGGILYQDTTVNTITGGFQIVDSWMSSGGGNRNSYKNHHYVFDANSAATVSMKMTSDTDNYMFLVNSLDFVVGQVSGNLLNVDVEAGTYRLVAATWNPYQTSNFVLDITGDITKPAKVSSNTLEVVSEWISSGGRQRKSYANKHYNFDVAQDSFIDIEIQSNGANYLYLVDSLDMVVGEVSGNHLFAKVPADSYRLVAATWNPNIESAYTLQLTGQFSNLTEEPAARLEFNGAWVSSGGRNRNSPDNNRYDFDVTEDSLVDIKITSGVANYLYLIDNANDLVVTEVSGNRLSTLVKAGNYRLVAATYSPAQTSSYILNMYGKIENVIPN